MIIRREQLAPCPAPLDTYAEQAALTAAEEWQHKQHLLNEARYALIDAQNYLREGGEYVLASKVAPLLMGTRDAIEDTRQRVEELEQLARECKREQTERDISEIRSETRYRL
jgi:hypothetical protein